MLITRELVGSGYFQNWKEPPGFMKEVEKNLQFSMGLPNPLKFLGTTVIYENQVFES